MQRLRSRLRRPLVRNRLEGGRRPNEIAKLTELELHRIYDCAAEAIYEVGNSSRTVACILQPALPTSPFLPDRLEP